METTFILKDYIKFCVSNNDFFETKEITDQEISEMKDNEAQKFIYDKIINVLCWVEKLKRLRPNNFEDFLEKDLYHLARDYSTKKILNDFEEQMKNNFLGDEAL